MSLSFTPWELESQRWHSPSYIQLDAMPCRDFGHYRPNVRVHQARDCRPVVAINFVLSFLKGPTLLGISSLSAMCIENLEGDYYIPGSIPDGAEGIWKEAQAWSRLKTINSWKQCHVFYLDHFRSYLISFLCDRKRLNHRWSCGQTVWCRTTTAKLPRMPVRSKRLGWWLGSKFIESPNWMCSIIEKFFENPEQKLAQRDASAMQDIFSLSCFMSWLLPKMEVQLGRNSSILEKIKEMWDLGFLGSGAALWWEGYWKSKNHMTHRCYSPSLGNPVEFKFRSTDYICWYGCITGTSYLFWVVGFPHIQNLDFVLWNLNSAGFPSPNLGCCVVQPFSAFHYFLWLHRTPQNEKMWDNCWMVSHRNRRTLVEWLNKNHSTPRQWLEKTAGLKDKR